MHKYGKFSELFLLFLYFQNVSAAGFQIREQSGLGQSLSFAGAAAGYQDANSVFFNGASMALFKKNTFSTSTSIIHFSGDFDNELASTALNGSISGTEKFKHETTTVPAVTLIYSATENLKIGINVSAPWGLKTDYDPNWVGRYYAIQSELHSININPLIAFKFHNKYSYSVGLQTQYLDVEIDNAIDFGTLGFVNAIPGAIPASINQDGLANIQGDDWGFGWTAGLLFEPSPNTRIGLAYRSKISHKLKGTADFSLDSGGVGSTLTTITGAFTNTNSRSRIETPEFVSFGVRHDFNHAWSIMAELDFTRWSRLDQLVIQFANPAQSNNITSLEWDDTWFGSIGVEYRPNDRFQFRSGIAYEDGASPNDFRSPRVPDADRLWFSLGGSYILSNRVQFYGAYSYLRFNDPTLALSTSSLPNVLRGNLNGKYNLNANIIAVGFSISL